VSDNTDIAARTQRFREAVRAFTPRAPKRCKKLMPMEVRMMELRQRVHRSAVFANYSQPLI
jgi:hypothetical protein